MAVVIQNAAIDGHVRASGNGIILADVERCALDRQVVADTS